jgi:hypothetical protein
MQEDWGMKSKEKKNTALNMQEPQVKDLTKKQGERTQETVAKKHFPAHPFHVVQSLEDE